MVEQTFDKTIIQLNKVESPKLIWVFFHYMGGSATTFFSWRRFFDSTVQLYAVQLPGRDGLSDVDFLYDFNSVIANCLSFIYQLPLNVPFVFFGHSMGAMIGYEMISSLERNKELPPHLLVVSGCKAPQDIKPVIRKEYTDEQLVEKLSTYGGTPQAILSDQELLQRFLPRMRADMSVLNSYYSSNPTILDCPIVAFAGEHDQYVPSHMVNHWQTLTRGEFFIQTFIGGHFFINQFRSQLIGYVETILDTHLLANLVD